ncbi:MAG: PQQ-like beta-propeller repeat protein [Ktedonobacteraceae bacterium]|nr:PQQ-like beta-propeller repeat protein [Ktedonobacteraceae bacterium]MBV9614574.1 PQQ-like beta-propeller repeat protein [Ktedonobacteraceae bacterium]
MQQKNELKHILPPQVIQVSQDTVYVQIANRIYVIREQKNEIFYDISGLDFLKCSIAENMLYVILKNTHEEVLQALRISDNVLPWASARKDILLPPLVKEGKLYLCEKEGISALDSKDGTQIWRCSLNSWFSPLIALQGETLYGLSQGEHPTLYVLDSNTGTVLRNFSLSPFLPAPATSLIVTSQTFILDTPDGCMVWHTHDGSFAWQYNDTAITPMIEANNEYIYLSYPPYRSGSSEDHPQSRNFPFQGGGFICALRQGDGSVAWKYQMSSDGLSGMSTPPVITDKIVYVGMSTQARQCSLIALHPETGVLLWKYHMQGTVLSSPFVKDHAVYVGLDDGYLYALNASTGSLLWKIFVSTSYQMEIDADGTVERLL